MIDISKPVRTKSGLSVRIVSRLNNGHPIAGVLTAADGVQTAEQWTLDGFKIDASTPDPLDLENLPEPTKGFANVYETAGGYELDLYDTRSGADRGARAGRIARVFLSFTPGQFD